jgi:hypothetical protein
MSWLKQLIPDLNKEDSNVNKWVDLFTQRDESKDSFMDTIKSLFEPKEMEMKPGAGVEPEVQRQLEAASNVDEFGNIIPDKYADIYAEEPQEPVEDPWVAAGRPATNPHREDMENVFGPDTDAFEKLLRWGTPDDQPYGVNYGGENLSFDGTAEYTNTNGTIDKGLIQANEVTFNELKNQNPEFFKEAGLNSIKDLEDVRKNLIYTRLLESLRGMVWFGASKTAPGSDRGDWPNAPYDWGQKISTQPMDYNLR